MFQAHRLLYHSTLGSRVIDTKKKGVNAEDFLRWSVSEVVLQKGAALKLLTYMSLVNKSESNTEKCTCVQFTIRPNTNVIHESNTQ